MKKIIPLLALSVALFACGSNQEKTANAAGDVHQVVVQEVLQSSQYTYLRVKENDTEAWLAVPVMDAAAGQTYFYKGGLTMHGINSKELNRNFEDIIFVDRLSATAEMGGNSETGVTSSGGLQNEAADAATMESSSGPVAAVAEEVLQTSKYTYIRAKVKGEDTWLAMTRMDAKTGTTYYYTGGLLMSNFESKELKRTFDKVYFLDNISTDPSGAGSESNVITQDGSAQSKGSNIDLEKKNVSIEHAKGELTISEVLQNSKQYSGKKVRLKGEVIKYNSGIMGRNWIHLQDGTDYKGKFDLTITTTQEVAVGDKIMVEGTIITNKDFGYGYFYEVLLEDANLIK